MPNPHPIALRTRAVAAYEAGEGSYVAIAEQFAISVSSLLRWVERTRTTGDVRPLPKRGGWHSVIEAAVLTAVIAERPDATVAEIRRAYNRRVRRAARASRSGLVRAMQREGYVLKKNAAGRVRLIAPMST
jgi:transposase